jgi:hypothetical protein
LNWYSKNFSLENFRPLTKESKMEQTIKTRWLNALRSGEYAQGNGTLKSNESETAKFCCLGVLCDIQGVDWDVIFPFDYEYEDFVSRQTDTLPKQYLQPDPMTREFLANSNDGNPKNSLKGLDITTFNELADWIQKNLNDDLSRKHETLG